MVIELERRRAGTVTWERVNQRSRIASVGGLAVDPAFRGRGVGVEAARALQRHLLREVGFHRLQMEVYGFNERALRLAERAGWVREEVRRKAYRRNDTWGRRRAVRPRRGGPRGRGQATRRAARRMVIVPDAQGSRHPNPRRRVTGFLVALGAFAAAVVVGLIFFATGHEVLGIVAPLMSLPFALATWLKWFDRGI